MDYDKKMFSNDFLDKTHPGWTKKRLTTFYVYCFIFFIAGAERGFKNATLWIYVNQFMKLNNPYFWFGMINSCMYFCSLCLNPFISAIVDKIRKPKYILIPVIAICITGHVIYIIPLSPLYPAIGLSLIGFQYVLRPIMIGEIARSYPYEEIAYRLPMLTNCLNIGAVSAYLFLIPFQNVDFQFFDIQISYGNVTGFLGMILYLFAGILTVLYVHNLSKEYDLKAHQMTYFSKNPQVKHESNFISALKTCLSDIDLIIVLIVNVLYGFILITTALLMPIFVISDLHLSKPYLNIGFFTYTFLLSALSIVLFRTKVTSLFAYLVVFIGFSSMTLLNAVILIATPDFDHNVKVLIVIFSFLMFAMFVMVDDLFLPVATAKLLPSQLQSTVEGFRCQTRHFFSLLAGLTIKMVNTNFLSYVLITTIISSTALLIMAIRYKRLSDPKPKESVIDEVDDTSR